MKASHHLPMRMREGCCQVKPRSGHWFLDGNGTASHIPMHIDTPTCMVPRAHWQVLIIRWTRNLVSTTCISPKKEFGNHRAVLDHFQHPGITMRHHLHQDLGLMKSLLEIAPSKARKKAWRDDWSGQRWCVDPPDRVLVRGSSRRRWHGPRCCLRRYLSPNTTFRMQRIRSRYRLLTSWERGNQETNREKYVEPKNTCIWASSFHILPKERILSASNEGLER